MDLSRSFSYAFSRNPRNIYSFDFIRPSSDTCAIRNKGQIEGKKKKRKKKRENRIEREKSPSARSIDVTPVEIQRRNTTTIEHTNNYDQWD